jgi:hypothetical protein
MTMRECFDCSQGLSSASHTHTHTHTHTVRLTGAGDAAVGYQCCETVLTPPLVTYIIQHVSTQFSHQR